MSAEEFREAGYRHVDWIADYLEHVREFPVTTDVQPGMLARSLPESAPDEGESIDRILEDFKSSIFPGLTLWNHPRFFAWFSVSSTPPSILAEFITAALNVNAMLWKSAPAATELEQVTLNWLREWLSLDKAFFGIIYDTASAGVMQPLASAREWVDRACW